MPLEFDILLHDALRTPEFVDSVVLVGNSGSGKTTLIRNLRESELVRTGLVHIPKRFITRDKRLNDDLVENEHIDERQFEGMLQGGEIDLNWTRNLASPTGKPNFVNYGFAPPCDSTVNLYSANNDLLNQTTRIPKERLEKMIFMAVYCPDDIRRIRFEERSPDLLEGKAWEADLRLGNGRFAKSERKEKPYNGDPLEFLKSRGIATLEQFANDPDYADGIYKFAAQFVPLMPRQRPTDLLKDTLEAAHFTILAYGKHIRTASTSFIKFVEGIVNFGDPILAQVYANSEAMYSRS